MSTVHAPRRNRLLFFTGCSICISRTAKIGEQSQTARSSGYLMLRNMESRRHEQHLARRLQTRNGSVGA